MKRPANKSSFFSIGLAAYVLLFAAPLQAQPAPPAPAAANTPPAVQGSATANAASAEPFVYLREGRPDPFFPFLTQEIMKAEAKAMEELTGMQKFEPGQLTLVAIVFAGREPLAMVQDSAGIGYVLRRGTKIGRTGEVIDIVSNKVLIEQIKSLDNEQKKLVVEMTLKTEGEK